MTDRYRTSRRTALRTIGALCVAAGATGSAGAREAPSTPVECTRSRKRTTRRTPGSVGEPSVAATRYVATVDRIVDGAHVVLLLEKDGDLVDQLVVSATEYDDLEEGDVLICVVGDDELLAYRVVPERPPDGVAP